MVVAIAGWQNQGYACYIVTRTYTEKVGLIDWRIGKRGEKRKKEREEERTKKVEIKKKKEKKEGGEKSTLKKMGNGKRYAHHLLASNPPKTSILP